MVKGAGIGRWMAGPERESREVMSKVDKPGFQDSRRDQVDFIEDEN